MLMTYKYCSALQAKASFCRWCLHTNFSNENIVLNYFCRYSFECLHFLFCHLPQHPHRVTSVVNRRVCGCYLLRRLALAVRDEASREEEETQSNGRRPKAFNATMFLIGHRFEFGLRGIN